MKLLDKYIFTQVFWSFLFGLGLVTIVWIAPELLPKVIREVVSGQLSATGGFLFILYEIPEVIVKSLPMGLLIGTLLVFDKLSKDSEITAMRACGIGIYRMLCSIILLGIIGTVIAFIINEAIVPSTSMAQMKIKSEGKITKDHFTFVDKDKQGLLKQVILIESFNGNTANNLRIINFNIKNSKKQGVEEIYAAAAANWSNKTSTWLLKDGIYYRLTESGVYEDARPFKELSVISSQKAYKLLDKSLKTANNMNIPEIKEYINLLVDSQHSDEAMYFKVRLHQKFSQPFAVIIMGIVGLILGIHPPRTSRFLGYTVGMFVILVYYFIWPLSMALGNKGVLDPFIAAWLPNFIAILIGFVILKYKDF